MKGPATGHVFEPLQHRKIKLLVNKTIAIEGLVGAGKTTFTMILEEYFKRIGAETVKLYEEKVNKAYLEMALKNPHCHSFGFQMFMLSDRIRSTTAAQRDKIHNVTSILDRSAYGDMAFEIMNRNNGFINIHEHEAYMEGFKEAVKPDYIIFLDIDPTVARARVENRNITCEVGNYDERYYTNLRKSYEIALLMAEQDGVTVLRMPYNTHIPEFANQSFPIRGIASESMTVMQELLQRLFNPPQ
jgi:deoxyadenosine/deoxycytidine kinase